MESCPDCGFIWEQVTDEELADRLAQGVEAVSEAVCNAFDPGSRLVPELWSVIEYAAHVRDVLLNVRDRIVIALVEDNPEFKPLYRDQRVDLGLYRADTAQSVSAEIQMAGTLFVRTIEQLDLTQLDRPCMYAFPTLEQRSIRWMIQQAIHEVEHHLGDIRSQLK